MTNDRRHAVRRLLWIALGIVLAACSAVALRAGPSPARASSGALTPMLYLPLVSMPKPPTIYLPLVLGNWPPPVQYRITLLRQLTPCENMGNHNLYVVVVDTQGNGLANTQLEFSWPSGVFYDTTGYKNENIPSLGINAQNTAGYVNFPMYKGGYQVQVVSGTSEQTPVLHTDIPVDEECTVNGDPVANSYGHYSYLIFFTKEW